MIPTTKEQQTHWFHKWFNIDYLNLYDHRDEQEAWQQVDFIIQALQLKGNENILDLGCGAGRHAIAFAEKGYPILGVDLSATLIQEALRALKQNPSLPVTFLQSDLFHLKDIGTFDIVLNLFTSFGYFDKDEENFAMLDVVKHHLRPGGKFFFDYLHPAEVKRNLTPREEKLINGEKVIIQKTLDKNQVIKTISFPGRTYQEKVKLYSREEIEKMLRTKGFNIIEIWNDYRGNPWKQGGDRQLFCCETFLIK